MIPIRRIIVSSRQNLPSARRIISIHQGVDRRLSSLRIRGVADVRESCDSITLNEDPTSSLSSSSSPSSLPSSLSPSSCSSSRSADYYYLKLGAGIVALSLNNGTEGDNTRFYQYGNPTHSTRRRYRSVAARCESSGSKSLKENFVEASIKTNDSFFDLAQKWANDNDPRKPADDIMNKNCDNDSTQRSPLAELLGTIGILGESDAVRKHAGKINEMAYDERSHLKGGMMDSVLSKVDEINIKIKSSFPKNALSPIVDDSQSPKPETGAGESISFFRDFFSSFDDCASLYTEKSSPDIQGLIRQAQQIAANHGVSPSSDSGSSLQPSSGLMSQILFLQQNAQTILERALDYFPDISNVRDLIPANPLSALHYYLEQQDATKTPSWKRRLHRYQRNVEVTKVEELNEALLLSELSYADSVDEVRAGLEKLHRDKENVNKPQWELLYCDTESRPNEPSHFLAIQKNAPQYDDVLHVLMVVRGTKSMPDLITDAMMKESDYEYSVPGEKKDGSGTVLWGKAHSGMQLSGKYLVDRHLTLLSTLLRLSKKRKIDISLIGHSLGAGAASIAAMEWNSKPFDNARNGIKVSAHVIGFGCPALLSKSLSLATKEYVTTVIADADFIPRMSGATLFNLLLDLKCFDYRMQAERDVEQALRETASRLTKINIAEDDIQSAMGYVRRGLEKVGLTHDAPSTEETTRINVGEGDANDNETDIGKRKEPVLFPPGDCIHFYRDGSGISGSYVPCDFFNEVRSQS